MGRHSKAKKAELQAELLRARAEEMYRKRNEETDDDVPAPKKTAEAQSAKLKPRPTKPKKATAEAPASSNDVQVASKRRGPKKSTKQLPISSEIPVLLEKLAATLSSIEGSRAFGDFLKNNGLENSELLNKLHGNCETISMHLQVQGGQQSSPPSTREFQGQQFVFRDHSKRFMAARTYKVFKGNSGYNSSKVVGWVQLTSTKQPLKYALPGTKKLAPDDPELLDSPLWAGRVKEWARRHNHALKEYMYDKRWGYPSGTIHASHTELKLALWFACNVVQKYFGIMDADRDPLGDLWQLPDMEKTIEAELVLSEEPCSTCKKFLKFFERVTKRVKFTIVFAPNLGNLKFYRNKSGAKKYPLNANNSDVEDGDLEEDREEEEGSEEEEDAEEEDDADRHVQIFEKQAFKKSELAVVIREKPIRLAGSYNSHREEDTEGFEGVAMPNPSKKPTKHQREIIHSFTRMKSTEVTRFRPYDDSDNESEWLPKSTYSRQYITPRKQFRPYALPTPDSDPFSQEARDFKESMKIKTRSSTNPKKRSAPVFHDFTTLSKKSRSNDYDRP